MTDHDRSARPDPHRRRLLGALVALAALPRLAWAGAGDGDGLGPKAAFSFDGLVQEMRALAATAYRDWEPPRDFWATLDYDDYRLIRFNEARTRWAEPDHGFRVQAFHSGWLFGAPVRLFEVADGAAREFLLTIEDFEYLNDLADRVPKDADLPGVAGVRLNAPLNREGVYDEVVSFLGASYFRALGQGNAYGLSARGIAIDTGTGRPEEFPHFSRFWLERPPPGAGSVTVCAALDGPSLTGAYRFVIRPGRETVMEVEASLFFRADVAQLGVAPLTSMFLFDAKNRAAFDDYRPAVHDSDGLRVRRSDGDVLWRPLNNPPRLATSFFAEASPVGFGLHQRKRGFDAFQDSGARYQDRPSLEVEPLGDWGAGAIALVEIPTRLEAHDNIVAFWVPEAPVRAGEARRYSYRLRWGSGLDQADGLGRVVAMRAGQGGVSGVESQEGTRKFVVDFAGGRLGDAALVPAPVLMVSGGEVLRTTLDRLEHDLWRLVLDVAAVRGGTVELGAHLAGPDDKLTETWLYQWIVV